MPSILNVFRNKDTKLIGSVCVYWLSIMLMIPDLKFYHFAFALILIVKTVYCRDYVAVFTFPVVVG